LREMEDDLLVIAGRAFRSRLLVGTGKFPSAEAWRAALQSSKTEIVTVALRRVDLSKPQADSIMSVLDPAKHLILPNTSGARTAAEAVRLARWPGPWGWGPG
jgi:thiazole synthase